MWALQLYIGFLPNFYSPFREPTASILRTVFSHGISIPQPTSWLSLGHFLSRTPGALFFTSWPGTYAHCHIYLIHVHLCFFRYCSLWVFGCFMCAGTCSAFGPITPSGIYSALACSLSHGIAFTFQSHPLMLAFRIPIPGSTVLTPPFAFLGVLSPGSILTYMSRPIHSTCLHL
jgi:hypothetical protein